MYTQAKIPTPPVWHISAILVGSPEFTSDAPTDLWIKNGKISRQPIPQAQTVSLASQPHYWILPGLVDAHCHIGMPASGAPMPDQTEMIRQAVADRNAGTLLVRDLGVPVDNRVLDEIPDMPQIIHCGRHVARPKRYMRDVAAEIDPQDLVAEIERQAAHSDGWIKLVGDWIDRDLGDLAPLWQPDQLKPAIARAHQLGMRVTAHTFCAQAVAQLVACGIDCIEHGTGLDNATMELMAQNQVALVPTLINIENFLDIANSAVKYPTYAAHMRHLYQRNQQTVAQAYEAGVPIYAGTDAGGTVAHGRIVDEIAALAKIGGNEFALQAASWGARHWLQGAQNPFSDGESADFLILDADPRKDLDTLRRIAAVVLRGRTVC